MIALAFHINKPRLDVGDGPLGHKAFDLFVGLLDLGFQVRNLLHRRENVKTWARMLGPNKKKTCSKRKIGVPCLI
jgi:hypothetical protein